MLKIFNEHVLTKNQRFYKALLYGIPSSIGLGVLYGLVATLLHFEFSIIYVAFGYLIGLVIQRKGRGVQPKFSILGAVLAVVCFVLGDMIAIFGDISILWTPSMWGFVFNILLRMYTTISISSVLSLLFRVAGVYYAYLYARIV